MGRGALSPSARRSDRGQTAMPILDALMPTPFAAGLEVWSSGDGTPGSDNYAQSGSGVIEPADQDFGGA